MFGNGWHGRAASAALLARQACRAALARDLCYPYGYEEIGGRDFERHRFPMDLQQLMKALSDACGEGRLDRQITGITYDSRRVMPGMVYVAIAGDHHDGHDFIPAAVERGAAAIVCERNGFVPQRATKIRVSDTRAALAHLSAAYYQYPSAKLKIIGVTGTNGKTTVAFLVKQILETQGLRTGLIGTIRYEIGDRILPAQRTTPEAAELHQMLGQMVRAGCAACVMEVSSHALEQKRVVGIDFDTAIFTNLTQDHLDYHGTMENYFQAKQKLFEGLGRGGKTGAAVINIDDEYGQRLSGWPLSQTIITYGFSQAAQVRATQVELGNKETRFVVKTPAQNWACQIPLIGRHNIYNVLAATGAALALGIEPSRIQSGLNRFGPVPGRLEPVDVGQPFSVYVDYAHTDDALSNVLTILREITHGRLLLAFGCGGNRDPGKRPKMGRIGTTLADFTIITNDNPRREPPEGIAAAIVAGIPAHRRDCYQMELDRRQAISELMRLARPGDTVLIAGKGHETYQEFADTIIPFDDRVYVRQALEHLGFRSK